LSRSKKKKKIAGQNLSLSERLERHWNNERWETFFSLYMRDRDASERGPWAAKFPDALYNCLTAAMFLHKNYDGTRQVAEMMLSERSLGADDDVLRECARTALDFINIREGRLNHPSDGEGRDISLPRPYEELRQKLADEFVSLPKRGRKKKGISNPTVEKFTKQFKALPSAKNSGPYTSFLKTAETLLSEAEGTDSMVIFSAIRDIASIMREIARGTQDFRDPTHVIGYLSSKTYTPLRTSHPAMLTLWEYMCGLGGRKFGDRWENAARVARMSLILLNEEFRPAYVRLTAANSGFPKEDLPIMAERHYDRWTEQERFILIFLAVTIQLKRDHGFFEDITANTILKWFKTLGEIGARRRYEGAWPETVRFAFEKIVITGATYLDSLVGEDLPFEYMSTATIVVMVLYAPHTLKLLKDRLKSSLPLNLSDADEGALGNFFPTIVFPVHALKAVSELLDRKGNEIFFKSILMSIMRTDISRIVESASYRPVLWVSVSQSHIALFVENLPEDSLAAAFCRLCIGRKPMSLSDDPSKIAAFFASRPENSLFNATLSLLLMSWPGISAEFLMRIFEASLGEHERIDEWDALPKIISKIQSPNDRKNIAQGVLRILRRRYKNRMSSSMRFAVKALDTLEKKGKLPGNYEDELQDRDALFNRIFERMFNE
jgi:hypothetical protein